MYCLILGLNYSMSDDEDIDNTPAKKYLTPQEFITPSNQIIPNKQLFSGTKEKASHIPRLKYEPTSSEKKQTIKCTVTKDLSKPNFKIPGLPPRSKLTHTTPQKACPNLKDIVSPVALYIKNSPRFPLKQNVPLKELSKIVTSTSTSTKSANKANLFAEMPEVIYKPSKKQIVSTEKHIVIPPYMRKLNIRVAQITKHEGRINHESDRSKVSEKLLLADITNRSIDQSLLDSTGDISVLTNKQAFIK